MPELSAVVDAVAVPLKATVAPAPLLDRLPEIVQVWAAVKFTPVTLAPLTLTGCEAGVKENPDLDGVTV